MNKPAFGALGMLSDMVAALTVLAAPVGVVLSAAVRPSLESNQQRLN